jgi:5-methylcytosine-specific restriction endonuclease McrA
MKQRQYSHGRKVRADSKSGYRGVQRDTRSSGAVRYQAYVMDPTTKKKKVLGTYHDAKLAAEVADEANVHYYGDDAILNFPLQRSAGIGRPPKTQAQFRKALKTQFHRHNAECKTCGEAFYKKSANHVYCNAKCRPSQKSNWDNKSSNGRFVVLNRDKFRCIYCGKSSATDENIVMHIDHVHPVAKGGTDKLSNLVTSCSDCNLSKRDTILSNEKEMLQIVENRNTENGLNPDKLIKLN